jgi:hypothetical protein
MLKGNEGPELVCQFCGVHVWPRCGGYWFLLLSPRGRVRFPGSREVREVLCSGCGRRLVEVMQASGYALEALAEEVKPRREVVSARR